MPKQRSTERTQPRRGGRYGLRGGRQAASGSALMARVSSAAPEVAVEETAARAESDTSAASVPEATIDRMGGPITVDITFGHAQHGKYTIQLFEPRGQTELTRQSGLSTDNVPDRFVLGLSAAQLDQHILQWSGAVSAFTQAPGQRFSVIFDVTQDGGSVPGGRVERTGPLAITQVFLGILRLVAQ